MKVRDSQAMRDLLHALRIKRHEWHAEAGWLTLYLNGQQLMYTLNGAEAYVKMTYKATPEWQELQNFFKP